MTYKTIQSKSIKFKVTLATLSIFLISFWLLAFYAGRLVREDMEHLAGEQQFSTVSFMAAEINEELETRIKSLEKVASQITPPMLDHPASLQALLEQRPLLQILFNGGVFATGIDGTAIADVPLSAGRIGMNYMDRESISGPIKEGKSMVGHPAMGKKLAAPIFSLSVPIRDAQGKVIGVLAGTINLNLPSFLDKLTGNGYGKTGGYLLVAPQYRLVVTATDKRRIMTPASPPGSDKLIDRFMQGYEGTGILVNSLGVEVLASAKRIPVAGWYVAASLPAKEAFAPIHAMQHRLLLADILITLMAGGLTWWILRQLLSPMFAAITTISAMTETGQPAQPLPIVRNDEIGQLIGGFNRLLKTLAQREENLVQAKKKLRSILQSALDGFYLLDNEGRFLEVNAAYCIMSGYTEQELLTMRISDVEANETADETAARLQKIITQGHEHFETRHRRKDGSIFEVEVSALHQLIDGGRFSVFLHDISEYKMAQKELLDSEKRYRSYFELGLVGVAITSPTKGCIEVNDKICEILGYKRSELLQMNWAEFTHPDDLAADVANFERVLAGESDGYEMEKRFIRKGGQIVNAIISVKCLRREDGSVDYLVSLLQDITERKQAEYELQRSRDFLAETEKIGKVGGWEFDMDTLEQTWTEEVYRIHEVNMDYKPTVENGINFYAPSSRPVIENAVRRAMEYGEPYDVELEINTAKGNLRSVHAIGKVDLAKRRVFGFFQDITERKQAEEALKNSEERYHQLFEMESDTVLMTDWESGRILEVNSAATRMYGYSLEEFLQLTPSDLSFEPTDTEKSIRDEETAVTLRWHRKKDGTVFPVEISASYFVYQGRKVHVAAIRDITKRVQAEDHLIDLNQRLRALGGHLQSVQEQERLAISRDMHDDVGQILTALKLDLTWLEQNIAPSENALPLRLDAMHKNIDQITAVVQRIAANLRPPLLDNQGLSAAIEWHVGEFSKRSGLECFVMINEDTGPVDKETATAIMRIIQEGLTNITRHARATEAGISLCTRDGNLILEITDNGCGITPEQIAAHDAYGLMGMQERATLCNGKLEIKGEPGCGTTLLLTIPLGLGELTV